MRDFLSKSVLRQDHATYRNLNSLIYVYLKNLYTSLLFFYKHAYAMLKQIMPVFYINKMKSKPQAKVQKNYSNID